ncbi:unnamed protein product [Phytophthora fragariaefolia]|uniref:Unnamed protein product n=1 Tax=Phytophthora fragariaefolia TaxID=1490495 RepID=A0A9W6YIE4_9STRA|nr:unnamed protein product [Phytophthora fragariaefolia]
MRGAVSDPAHAQQEVDVTKNVDMADSAISAEEGRSMDPTPIQASDPRELNIPQEARPAAMAPGQALLMLTQTSP